MDLRDFPAAIADVEAKLIAVRAAILHAQDHVARLEASADRQIVYDPELKNEAQRKLRRSELLEAPVYLDAIADLRCAHMRRDELQVRLSLLYNQFAVAKLEKREAIAQLEVQADPV